MRNAVCRSWARALSGRLRSAACDPRRRSRPLERFVGHLMHAGLGEHEEAQGQVYQQTCERIPTGGIGSGALMPEVPSETMLGDAEPKDQKRFVKLARSPRDHLCNTRPRSNAVLFLRRTKTSAHLCDCLDSSCRFKARL